MEPLISPIITMMKIILHLHLVCLFLMTLRAVLEGEVRKNSNRPKAIIILKAVAKSVFYFTAVWWIADRLLFMVK